MSAAPRNFNCPATDEQCRDPRCKHGFCINEIGIAARHTKVADAEAKAEIDKYYKEIEKFARAVWREKGVRNPTNEQMQRAMSHPKITETAIDLAKRR